MNNDDVSRYSKRFLQYFWDPLPKNDDSTPICCLGRMYDSEPSLVTPASPPPADSTASPGKEQVDEALQKGWPSDFVADVEAKLWLTYRSNFPPIAKSADPKAAGAMSLSTRLKLLGNQGGFTSDTGWGCMIRSGQTLLANCLMLLETGRDWRRSGIADAELSILSLFADDPSAPFSIHRFVEHGAAACGKHPGEWFGPSATARCIQALTRTHHPGNLRVYVRPDDSDVYEDSLFSLARDAAGNFQPTLILLGTRLGIDRVTPVYRSALSAALAMTQSVGIVGGRPSSSHYFIGTQGSYFFYLDPHTTRPALPCKPTADDCASCHTRRLRRIHIDEMDPSMLLGFLIRSEDEWKEWRKAISQHATSDTPDVKAKPIIHIHDTEPQYSGSGSDQGERTGERAEAVDEVESCDEDETLQ